MLLNKRISIRYLFGKAWYEVLLVTFLSSLTYLLDLVFKIPDLPISVPAFLGTAISLVMAFKLAQSYDRWWEARKIWGAIVNDSRTLVVQAKQFTGAAFERIHPLVKEVAFRQIAWCYCLGQSLRKLNPTENLHELLSVDELERVQQQVNVPLALLDQQSKSVAHLHTSGKINDYQQMQLDATLVRLVESMGQAERIKNTVFPATYRIYLHLFIYLFLFLMSISLTPESGIWQIIVLTLISIPFMFLEKTSYLLLNPFENQPTDTPVTSIARNIEINLRQLVEDDDIPEPIQPTGFYIM